jgi:hypothetical protein
MVLRRSEENQDLVTTLPKGRKNDSRVLGVRQMMDHSAEDTRQVGIKKKKLSKM